MLLLPGNLVLSDSEWVGLTLGTSRFVVGVWDPDPNPRLNFTGKVFATQDRFGLHLIYEPEEWTTREDQGRLSE